MQLDIYSDCCPCRLYDSRGNEIKWVTWCDTDSGYVEQLVTDDGGEFVVRDGEVERRTCMYPAPLRVESISG